MNHVVVLDSCDGVQSSSHMWCYITLLYMMCLNGHSSTPAVESQSWHGHCVWTNCIPLRVANRSRVLSSQSPALILREQPAQSVSVESPQSGLDCTQIWTEDTSPPFSSLKLCKLHSDRIKSSQIRLSLYNLYLMTVCVYILLSVCFQFMSEPHSYTKNLLCEWFKK